MQLFSSIEMFENLHMDEIDLLLKIREGGQMTNTPELYK